MRTKTLLYTAALTAAGILTGAAQVYSINVVGYVNTTLAGGNKLSLISNPLMASSNKISDLLGDALAEGSTVYKFNSTTKTYDILTYDFGAWDGANLDLALAPGEGAFVLNAGTDATVTFVGEVKTGDLSHALPQGISMQSSEVPQAGGVSSVLGLPAQDGDILYKWNGSAYDIFAYDFGVWDPSEPSVAVGEAFFYLSFAGGNWSRNFSVPN